MDIDLFKTSVEHLEKLIDSAQKNLSVNGSILSNEQKEQLISSIRTAQLQLAELKKIKSNDSKY